MKKCLAFLLILSALCMSGIPAGWAEEDVNGIWIQIQEGMDIFLPDNWTILDVTDEMKAEGIFFAVASPDGLRTCRLTRDPSSTDAPPVVPTELRDWFEDHMNNTIPLGAYFTVKDVQTGLTFQAHRYGGTKNMSAEPVTAEDTAVMKELGGGKLNRTRRPILIQFEGRVYAASMTTKESGVEWNSHIRPNKYKGTFTIFFWNSQTGENKVDQAHQNAVEQAALASW